MVSENSDLGAVPQVLQTDILLLHHPREVAHAVVNPNVRVAGLVVVVQQAVHSAMPATPAGHVSLVNALAFQSLGGAGLQYVTLLQYRSHPYLQLHRPVTEVPDPGAEPRRMSVITAPIKATPQRKWHFFLLWAWNSQTHCVIKGWRIHEELCIYDLSSQDIGRVLEAPNLQTRQREIKLLLYRIRKRGGGHWYFLFVF